MKKDSETRVRRIVGLEGEAFADVGFGHDAVKGAVKEKHQPSGHQQEENDDPAGGVNVSSIEEEVGDDDEKNSHDLTSSNEKAGRRRFADRKRNLAS